MKILFTGITGLIGKHLAKRLRHDGHELFAITRDREKAMRTFGLPCEFFENEIPSVRLAEMNAVINLAGENIASGRWTKEKKKAILESRVGISRQLADQISSLAGKGPRIFISASAVGYYGDRPGEIVSETSSPGSGFLAEVCRAWEHETLERKIPGVRQCVIRIAPVLAAQGGTLEKMLPAFRSGLGGTLGDGKSWMSWIHIDDLVNLFEHVLQNEISGPVNGTSPEPVTNETFTRSLAATLGRPAFFRVPRFALKLALGELGEMLLTSVRAEPRVALSTRFNFKFPRLEKALSNLLHS